MNATQLGTISIDPAFSNRLTREAIMRNATDVNGIKRAYIPLCLLESCEYQRPCNATRVRKIADEWNDYKANEIVVSYRDGVFYVIDGQHTVAAAQIVGKTDLYCKIYDGLTFEQEANLFVSLNEMQTRVSRTQKYKALVLAGDEIATTLHRLCEEFGIVTVRKHASDRPVLGGMRAAQNSIEIVGENGLRWAFEVIRDGQWHMVFGAYSEIMLVALRAIYKSHLHELDETKEKLAFLLKHCDFRLLKAKANISFIGRGSSTALIALLESYLEGSMREAIEA